MDTAIAVFLDEVPVGVLATTRPDGGPRLSTVYFVRDDDRILVSTESTRGKARDVERTGRASLCVQGADHPFPCVTVEGPARIVRDGIGAPTALILGRILGTPPPDPQPDDDLAAVGRVILAIDVERAYGASYLGSAV